MNRTPVNLRVIAAAFALALAATGLSPTLAAGRLATSASKVDVSAEFRPATDNGEPRIRVRLDMAEGWHVNAHPASLDFLVATTIEARAGGETLALDIAWPEGHDSDIRLGGTRIQVYSDNTVIPVQLARTAAARIRAAGQLTLNVRVQACSDRGICLPPSTLTIHPRVL